MAREKERKKRFTINYPRDKRTKQRSNWRKLSNGIRELVLGRGRFLYAWNFEAQASRLSAPWVMELEGTE